MNNLLQRFEGVVRSINSLGESPDVEPPQVHPFDERNIHPDVAAVSRRLFDDGHYSQATFEAFKFIDNKVKEVSGINESGFKLMMAAFNESGPKIQLNKLENVSDIDEQMGFRFIFAGSMSAIRNPRGHEIKSDPVDACLDHLSIASVLFRTFENRKFP